MVKKLICIAIAAASVVVFASCSCSGNSLENTFETKPPASIAVDEKVPDGQVFGALVTGYKWIDEETGSTIEFKDDGTFEGKVDGKDYKGRFTQKRDEKEPTKVILGVTLEGTDTKVNWTLEFQTTSEKMTLTTDTGVSETYVQEWATKN